MTYEREELVHERVEIPLDRLLSIEYLIGHLNKSESAIEELYRSWRSGAMEHVNVVDATAEDPMQFRLPNHNGQFSAVWPSRTLKDFPALMHARLCAAEYAQCLRNERPTAHYIHHTYDSVRREYFRLIVPLSETRLAYQFRLIPSD